jgi:hypothetical protein
MPNYLDYKPAQHTGLPLYAIEDGAPTADDAIPMVLRLVTSDVELAQAALMPFYYVVDVGADDAAAAAEDADAEPSES